MTTRYDTRVQREKERLESLASSGEVTQADSDAIEALLEYVDSKQKASTASNYSQCLRLLAKRMGVPLTEASLDDVNNTLDAMSDGSHPDVKDDGIDVHRFQTALRRFYEYHDELGIEKEEIEIDPNEGRDLEPSELLFEEEVDTLLNACIGHPRDRAFIALALATAQRIDALRTLRLRHIETDGPTMQIQLNTDEGALKGATGGRPLLWSKHYVREWLEGHPYTDESGEPIDPEAPLFCAETNIGRKVQEGKGKDPKDPIAYNGLRRALKRRTKDAGIEKQMYPHLLRHCGITRMCQEGLSEQQIKQLAGWDGDSSEFDRYNNLANKLNNDAVRETLGMPTTGEKTWVGRPSLDQCPNCGDQLPEGKERCPTCNTPMTHREYQEGGGSSSLDVERVAKTAADNEEVLEELLMEIKKQRGG